MIKQFKTALLFLIFFSFLIGFVYPLFITGISQLVFPYQANGSLIKKNGQIIGSDLIGQQFDKPQFFWGRLSSTTSVAYNASASGGSNLSVANPNLEEQVKLRLIRLQETDPDNLLPVPVDLVTASSSGLDPNISIAAAYYQATRIANERGLSLKQVRSIITQHVKGRLFGFLGEPTVNVLELNIALDEIQ